jgi:hypothetical protein
MKKLIYIILDHLINNTCCMFINIIIVTVTIIIKYILKYNDSLNICKSYHVTCHIMSKFIDCIMNIIRIFSFVNTCIYEHESIQKLVNTELKIRDVESKTGRKIIFLISNKDTSRSYPTNVYCVSERSELNRFLKYYYGIQHNPIDIILHGTTNYLEYNDLFANIIYHHKDSRCIVPLYTSNTMSISALSAHVILMNSYSSIGPISTHHVYYINNKNYDICASNVLIDEKHNRKKYDNIISRQAIIHQENDIYLVKKFIGDDHKIIDVMCRRFITNKIQNKQYLMDLGITKISNNDVPQNIMDLFIEVIL